MGVDRRALPEGLDRRARLFGTGAGVGLVAGVLATVALTIYGGSLAFGTTKAFALGALALGIGTLGWSGSVAAGTAVETMQRHLDTGTDWTEADSRRAMTRVAGFGSGMMLTAGVPSLV